MDTDTAVAALGALAQSTRLEAFKLLVRHEPSGLPAGEIAAQLSIPQNTLSTHLAVLTRAGLARADRQGRSIIYRADLAGFRELNLFLLRDCCAGSPVVCAPIADVLAKTACC